MNLGRTAFVFSELGIVIGAILIVFVNPQAALAKADPAPTLFAFILPARTSVTFRQPAQISVSFMPVNPKVGDMSTCRRISLSDEKDASKTFEFWFDQGTPPSTILIWKGEVLRAIRCKIGDIWAPEATLYITGSIIPAFVPTADVIRGPRK